MRTPWIILSVGLALTGCSSPAPVLYPNAHLTSVGQATATRDIEECRAVAESSGASSHNKAAENAAKNTVGGGAAGAAIGAVGGALRGSAGSGAMIGAATGATAGLLRGLFKNEQPSKVHMRFVNRCLRDRGYETIGWE
jgi:outer membrane lipoprotein SlyB